MSIIMAAVPMRTAYWHLDLIDRNAHSGSIPASARLRRAESVASQCMSALALQQQQRLASFWSPLLSRTQWPDRGSDSRIEVRTCCEVFPENGGCSPFVPIQWAGLAPPRHARHEHESIGPDCLVVPD